MSDSPVFVSVETAQALLGALRGIKDDFRVVDTAVVNRLRDRGKRDTSAATDRAVFHLLFGGFGGCVSAYGASVAVGKLIGFDPTAAAVPSTNVEWIDFPVIVGSMVGAGVAGHRSLKRSSAALAAADERRGDFLVAGVAAELALGDLRTALDNAQRGRPDSMNKLAEQAVEARETFENYVAAAQTLDENDVTVPFPWLGDLDATEARELLAANTEEVLAQIGFVATDPEELRGLPGRRRAPATDVPSGELDALAGHAGALRTKIAEAGRTLDAVEDVLRQRARHAPADSDRQLLERLADLVGEAYQRAGFAEADCLSIENTATQSAKADTARGAFAHWQAAPSPKAFRNTFQGYAVSLQAAAVQLTVAAPSTAAQEAGAPALKAAREIDGLTSAAMTVADAAGAAASNLTRRART